MKIFEKILLVLMGIAAVAGVGACAAVVVKIAYMVVIGQIP